MTSIVRWPTYSTSSSVLNRWRLKRIDEWASSALAPSAAITYEGSSVEEVQAEPDDSAVSLLRPISTDSPSTYANEMLRFPASRRSGRPLRKASSTLDRITSGRRPRRLAMRAFSAAMLAWAIAAARPQPTQRATGG